MTVAELIELLKAAPQDAEVLVDGYEYGAQPPRFAGMWRFWKDKAGGDSYGGAGAGARRCETTIRCSGALPCTNRRLRTPTTTAHGCRSSGTGASARRVATSPTPRSAACLRHCARATTCRAARATTRTRTTARRFARARRRRPVDPP